MDHGDSIRLVTYIKPEITWSLIHYNAPPLFKVQALAVGIKP